MMLVPTITAVSCIFIILHTETVQSGETKRTLKNVKWGKPKSIPNKCNGGSNIVHFSTTTVENHSDTPQKIEREFKLKFAETMSWSKTEGIEEGATVEVNAGINVKAVELGVTVSSSWKKQTSWNEGKAKTVASEDSIKTKPTVPARSKMIIQVTTIQVQIGLPFTGDLETKDDNGCHSQSIEGYMIYNTLGKGANNINVKFGKTIPLPPDNLAPLPTILPTSSRASNFSEKHQKKRSVDLGKDILTAMDQCKPSYSASVTGKSMACTTAVSTAPILMAPVKYGMMALSTIFFIILF